MAIGMLVVTWGASARKPVAQVVLHPEAQFFAALGAGQFLDAFANFVQRQGAQKRGFVRCIGKSVQNGGVRFGAHQFRDHVGVCVDARTVSIFRLKPLNTPGINSYLFDSVLNRLTRSRISP